MPADNPGLVEDCVALLTAEITLSAILNWDADIPMTEWEGVRIGGTPGAFRRWNSGGAISPVRSRRSWAICRSCAWFYPATIAPA